MELLLNSTSQDAPIQQNVAERMAFLIQDAVERRRQVVDNFRTVYRLRSRYVHHGEVSSIDRAISEFYLNARTVIAIACKNIGRFPTKERFLYAVDNIKFGAKGVQSTVSTSGAAP
jgi:hypothetical protein